jgi:hypothetical protein
LLREIILSDKEQKKGLGGKMMVCLDKNLALLIMEISGIIRRKKRQKNYIFLQA